MQENPDEQFVLETPKTQAKDYFYPFAKLYDTRTTLIENTRLKNQTGHLPEHFPARRSWQFRRGQCVQLQMDPLEEKVVACAHDRYPKRKVF